MNLPAAVITKFLQNLSVDNFNFAMGKNIWPCMSLVFLGLKKKQLAKCKGFICNFCRY
jgi:hypothetical protein